MASTPPRQRPDILQPSAQSKRISDESPIDNDLAKPLKWHRTETTLPWDDTRFFAEAKSVTQPSRPRTNRRGRQSTGRPEQLPARQAAYSTSRSVGSHEHRTTRIKSLSKHSNERSETSTSLHFSFSTVRLESQCHLETQKGPIFSSRITLLVPFLRVEYFRKRPDLSYYHLLPPLVLA